MWPPKTALGPDAIPPPIAWIVRATVSWGQTSLREKTHHDKTLLTHAIKNIESTWERAQHEPASEYFFGGMSLTLLWTQATVLRTQPPRDFCQDDKVGRDKVCWCHDGRRNSVLPLKSA
jgi:hypothetical protein